MAWKYDMNGRRVFDDGVIGTRGTGETLEESRRREEGTAGTIRRAAIEIAAGAVRPGIAFTSYKDPWLNDDVVRGAPFQPTPAPTVSGAGVGPFVPAAAPARLPPETVEATRLPPERPIIEATVMRRGRPGSGEFGENADLTPVSVRDFTPMSRAEAEGRGLLMRPERPFRFEQIGRAPGGVNAGMGHSLDASNRATMDATREARWGQGGPTRAALFSSVESVEDDRWGRGRGARREERVRVPYAGPPRGVQGRVDAILDTRRGTRLADAESGRRMREARVTPVATGDTVYDPLTGRAHTAPAKGPVKPQAWDEYAPEDLEGMINRTVKSILPADQEKAMWAELGTATTDEAKAAVIGKYTRQATPEQRLILDNAYEALRRKNIVKGGGKGGEGKKSIGGITAN